MADGSLGRQPGLGAPFLLRAANERAGTTSRCDSLVLYCCRWWGAVAWAWVVCGGLWCLQWSAVVYGGLWSSVVLGAAAARGCYCRCSRLTWTPECPQWVARSLRPALKVHCIIGPRISAGRRPEIEPQLMLRQARSARKADKVKATVRVCVCVCVCVRARAPAQ